MNRSLALRRRVLALVIAGLSGAAADPGLARPARRSDCPVIRNRPAPAAGRWLPRQTIRGRHGPYRATGQVHLYLPRRYRPGGNHPLVIALHGWDSPVTDWQRRSEIAALADPLEAVVAVPAMGRTVYETEYLGHRRDHQAGRTPGVPGTRWIGEVVLPWLRRCLAVSPERSRTAILGYSTGGRGAVLVAQHYPLFGLVAGFSGTYDLEALVPGTGEYRIHALFYGERSRHPDRWKREQSVAPVLVEKLRGVQVVLAHGRQDRVVSYQQTAAMAKALRAVSPGVVERIDQDAGHDWAFWKAEVKLAMEAFGKLLQPAPRPPGSSSSRKLGPTRRTCGR
jgi:S-formylglutathione hydrolase FrmB